MNFEIKGALLERVVSLSDKLKNSVSDFLTRALRTGMDALEKASDTPGNTPTPDPSVQVILKSTALDIRDFIRTHSATMTDKEMAEKTGYALQTVIQYRSKMNIRRSRSGPREKRNHAYEARTQVERVNHFAPSPLTDEQKALVRANMGHMSNQQMAEQLGTTIAAVMQTKNEILASFIREKWKEMSDGDIARALNSTPAVVSRLRLQLGLVRTRGALKNRKIQVPIQKEELEKAITEDGLTLSDYGLRVGVTRERIRQIADTLGVNREPTALWYANRWGKPELANKEWVEKMLAEKGSTNALAHSLAVHENQVSRICSMHGITPPKHRRHNFQGTEELQCHHCHTPFTLYKSRLAQLEKKGTKRHFCGKRCFLEWTKTHGDELQFSYVKRRVASKIVS